MAAAAVATMTGIPTLLPPDPMMMHHPAADMMTHHPDHTVIMKKKHLMHFHLEIILVESIMQPFKAMAVQMTVVINNIWNNQNM